jgi:hypothetical protein
MDSALIYSLAALVFFIFFVLMFREPIGELLKRISKISKEGVSISDTGEKGKKDPGKDKLLVSNIDREDDFENLRNRATSRIRILGVGMTRLGIEELDSLGSQLHNANIDILMLDPKYLESNKEIEDLFSTFFDNKLFSQIVKNSYSNLVNFAEEHNGNENSPNKVRLRVYSHFQTFSMVIIDPELDAGEILVEFYLFQRRNFRPRFRVLNTSKVDKTFEQFSEEYERLWSKSKIVC